MAYIVNLVYKCMDIIPVIQNFIDFESLTSWRKIVVESSVISLGVLPILIFYFGEFQPWSILLTFVFLIVLRAEFGCVSGDRYTLTMRG